MSSFSTAQNDTCGTFDQHAADFPVKTAAHSKEYKNRQNAILGNRHIGSESPR